MADPLLRPYPVDIGGMGAQRPLRMDVSTGGDTHCSYCVDRRNVAGSTCQSAYCGMHVQRGGCGGGRC